MARRKYTKEEQKEWREAQQRAMQKRIQELTDTWRENPETIAELFEFGSHIYQYSPRNTMLIYSQNPHATYAQSFQAWKEQGAYVKKGERGYRVYVPVEAAILKVDGKLIPLEHATKEQKARYKAGEIESTTRRHFKIGSVFDISQTTYPKEAYPKLYHMGYESALHGAVAEGLGKYAQNLLQCQVSTVDMKSIALRGSYSPESNRIELNELLEDTEKLSTLSHELGHALLHRDAALTKSTEQIEIEADALGIMIESHFGVDITESRRRHLAEHYRRYQKFYQEAEEEKKPEGFGDVIANVFRTFRKEIDDLDHYVKRELEKAGQSLGQEEKRIRESVKQPEIPRQTAAPTQTAASRQPEPQKPRQNPGEIYDRIKQNIRITDYAGMHGMELQRVGRYYTIKGHDSVRIDVERNCFWRNSGIGQTTNGSVIDFAMAFVHQDNLHESLKELSALAGGKENESIQRNRTVNTQPKPLAENLPERAKNMHRAYAYLTQTRFLEPDVVQDFVDRRMLYQDVRGNCVFVSYDEEKKPVFANFRGTLSERKFLGDVAGSDYRRGFYIDNGSDKVIVTESVIDAMSVMSILHGQGMDYKQYDYLPLSGATKHEPLYVHLSEHPKEQVLLALDHDLAGVKDMKLIQEKLLGEMGMKAEQVTFHVPGAKDWNQELVNTMKKLQPVAAIGFLQDVPLPEIRYCAVQSTQHLEERGFHKRNGQEQYRLVELNDKGEIVPMDIKRNVIFYSPSEVKRLIPEMYEEVPYGRLVNMGSGMTESQKPERVSAQEQETVENGSFENSEMEVLESEQITQEKRPDVQDVQWQEPEQNGEIPDIRGFEVTEGIVMATVLIDGIEEQQAVCRNRDGLYIPVGYAFDHSYRELELSHEQTEDLEDFIETKGLSLIDDSMILMAEKRAEEIKEERPGETGRKNGMSFLDALQKQEFQSQEFAPEPELTIGLGE